MNTPSHPPRRLAVEGELQFDHDRARLTVRGEGTSIVASIRDRRSLGELMRLRAGRRQRRLSAQRLHAALKQGDLTFDLRLADRTLARVGATARPNLLGRLAGLPHTQLRWPGLWAACRATWGV